MTPDDKLELEEKTQSAEPGSPDYLEFYGGDPAIKSFEGRIPKFLILTYILLPIWGVFQFYYFWNGSAGWFDRGYWHELQIAANTTFPIENQNMMPVPTHATDQKENNKTSLPKAP